MEMNRENGLSEHERFEELCALATSGDLSPDEMQELEDHIAECTRCREGLPAYQDLVRSGMASLAADFAEHPSLSACVDAEAKSKRELFRRLEAKKPSPKPGIVPPAAVQKWIGMAAMMVLVVALVAVGAYLAGRGKNVANLSLSQQLESLAVEKDKLEHELQLRATSLGDLAKNLKQQTDDLARLKEIDRGRQAQYDSVAKDDQEKTLALTSLSRERELLLQQIKDKDRTVQDLQLEFTSLNQQHQHDLIRFASFDGQIRELSSRLRDKDHAVDQQQQFLASDRDIRELMGARQLYIADVFDVDQTGAKRKPFGRVFYTKGKSLIFYAFDLDQRPGSRNAKAFQVWGTSGEETAKAQSLGIFYMDSETNRRWVFKSDDPTVLAQVNAVFVTVEAKGESKSPTGKPFLYAYLRSTPANHP